MLLRHSKVSLHLRTFSCTFTAYKQHYLKYVYYLPSKIKPSLASKSTSLVEHDVEAEVLAGLVGAEGWKPKIKQNNFEPVAPCRLKCIYTQRNRG